MNSNLISGISLVINNSEFSNFIASVKKLEKYLNILDLRYQFMESIKINSIKSEMAKSDIVDKYKNFLKEYIHNLRNSKPAIEYDNPSNFIKDDILSFNNPGNINNINIPFFTRFITEQEIIGNKSVICLDVCNNAVFQTYGNGIIEISDLSIINDIYYIRMRIVTNNEEFNKMLDSNMIMSSIIFALSHMILDKFILQRFNGHEQFNSVSLSYFFNCIFFERYIQILYLFIEGYRYIMNVSVREAIEEYEQLITDIMNNKFNKVDLRAGVIHGEEFFEENNNYYYTMGRKMIYYIVYMLKKAFEIE